MSIYSQYGFNGFGGSFPGFTQPWGGQFPGSAWNGGSSFPTPFGFGFGGVNPNWNSTGWNTGQWNAPTGFNGWNNWNNWNTGIGGFNQTAPSNQNIPFNTASPFGIPASPFGNTGPSFGGSGQGWNTVPFTGQTGWNTGTTPFGWNQSTPFGWNQSTPFGWNQSTPFGWNPAVPFNSNQGVPFGAFPFGWWNRSVPQTNGASTEIGATVPTNTPAYPFPFGAFNPFYCFGPQTTSNGTPVTKAA